MGPRYKEMFIKKTKIYSSLFWWKCSDVLYKHGLGGKVFPLLILDFTLQMS